MLCILVQVVFYAAASGSDDGDEDKKLLTHLFSTNNVTFDEYLSIDDLIKWLRCRPTLTLFMK